MAFQSVPRKASFGLVNAIFVLTNIAVQLSSYCLTDVILDPAGKGESFRIVVCESYLSYVKKKISEEERKTHT